MTVMTIVPHTGVGPLRFGMDRRGVAAAMGASPRTFQRTPFSLDEDAFHAMHVAYDEVGLCNAVTLVGGLGLDWIYDGRRLLGAPAIDVRSWAQSRDPALEARDGFLSRALGLAMWADWIDEPDLDDDERRMPARSFMVFRKGYYEDELRRMASMKGP